MLDIVGMTFPASTLSNSHKNSLLLALFYTERPAVGNATSNTTHKLMQHILQRPRIRNIAFHTFRIILLGVRRLLPHALTLGNIGTQASHASEDFHQLSVLVKDFRRGLFTAADQAAEHHTVGARGQGLAHVATEAVAAIRNQGHVMLLTHFGDVKERSELRHARTGHNTRDADAAIANAAADAISTRFNQPAGAVPGGNTAGHDVNGHVLLEGLDGLEAQLAVSIGHIHDQDISASFFQALGTHQVVGAYGSPDVQATLGVQVGGGAFMHPFDIFEGDEAQDVIVGIQNGKFFDPFTDHFFSDFGRGHHVFEVLDTNAFDIAEFGHNVFGSLVVIFGET